MERRRLQNPAAESAHCRGDALVDEQQSVLRQKEAPNLAKTDEVLDKFVVDI